VRLVSEHRGEYTVLLSGMTAQRYAAMPDGGMTGRA